MPAPGLGRMIYTQEQIQTRLREVAEEINRDYAGQKLVIISVLKGSIYFLADLTRQLHIPLSIDFLAIAASPPSENHSGGVHFTKDLDINLKDRHVLLVEDVIGTGLTLGYVIQHIENAGPASFKICTLLDNPAGRIVTVKIDYRCFTMPDLFLVGYGLDYREEYRNLSYIAEFHRP
ncbi:MAG TPA: hypoxanthine phosphoribosyltransferase [Syntrophomonas sp.]|nr:hypoxanthine phosphoribosyltransferase [Syntrophomonas sp.]